MEGDRTMGTIVVGVDGSPSAVNAVRWAAAEAASRDETVRLVHAYEVPRHGYPDFVTTFARLREGMRHQGEQWLKEARAAAEETAPGVAVETELVENEPVTVLIDRSRRCRLVVLGSRGLGGFTGMLVGSVALALAAHGRSPVVVVRGPRPNEPPPAEGRIVVGVDGSAPSTAALEFAFDTAHTRRGELVVVRVWGGVSFDDLVSHHPLRVDLGEIETQERTALDEQVRPWRDRYPEVPVETVVVKGRPARMLLDHAERAWLVVVGSRGREGIQGMLLGSTSRTLLTHAPCPVAVVRRSPQGEESADATP